MSVLTKDKILKYVKKGKIKIEPFNPESVGPASVDLTLGNKFRVFIKSKKIYDADNLANHHDVTKLIAAESIVVKPQETVLGITYEKISLPDNICGWLEGRSRFARLGLMIHISSSFMQPGISNHQVLEISNMGHVPLRLHAGTKICHFVFQRTIGRAKYQGKYQDQTEP